MSEGYKQMVYRGVPVKRRKVVCGRNREGDGGCGAEWYSYEIPECVLGDAFSGNSLKKESKPETKRKKRK
jgi:hypothetical protein